jgi:putative spermidine/putrescine transport system permease protein
MLFGSAFSAFATMPMRWTAARSGSSPAGSTSALSNNVLAGQDRIAMALGTEMIAVVMIVMVGYWFVQKRAGRWLR